MKTSARRTLMVLFGAGLLGCAVTVIAADTRTLCTSDGQTAPSVLAERFINADCADCWREPASPQTNDPRGTLTLDWIAAGPLEDQGALSAAARIDALSRLRSLGRALPPRSDHRTQAVAADRAANAATLRVAHGQPVGDYLGTSIEWRSAPPGRWRAWLLMVEELPAGTAGSPIARRLVRNSLQLDWTVPDEGSPVAPRTLFELRPMQIPAGAQADRLAVVGFIESAAALEAAVATDAPRVLVALANSRCDASP